MHAQQWECSHDKNWYTWLRLIRMRLAVVSSSPPSPLGSCQYWRQVVQLATFWWLVATEVTCVVLLLLCCFNTHWSCYCALNISACIFPELWPLIKLMQTVNGDAASFTLAKRAAVIVHSILHDNFHKKARHVLCGLPKALLIHWYRPHGHFLIIIGLWSMPVGLDWIQFNSIHINCYILCVWHYSLFGHARERKAQNR